MYWSVSLNSTNAVSFRRRCGLRSEEERSSFSLKCIPFVLRSRKCANLLESDGGGEPGGDGGIEGIDGGSVKVWI